MDRLSECPDADALELSAIEVYFAIPCFVTSNQQRQIIRAVEDIVDAPWNTPIQGVHWLAEMGAKLQWREPQEPTFDDSIFAMASCARGFVNEEERDRKLQQRAKPRRENKTRSSAIEALEAVVEHLSRITGLQGVHRKCRRALALLKEQELKERYANAPEHT